MTDIATVSNAEATASAVEAARRGEGVAVLVPCYNEARHHRHAWWPTSVRALPEATDLRLRQQLHRRHGGHRARRAGAVVRRGARARARATCVREHAARRATPSTTSWSTATTPTRPRPPASSSRPSAADEADMAVGDRHLQRRLRRGERAGLPRLRQRPGAPPHQGDLRLRVRGRHDGVPRLQLRAFAKTMPVHVRRLRDRDGALHPGGRHAAGGWRTVPVGLPRPARGLGVASSSTFSDGTLVLRGHRARCSRDYRPHRAVLAAGARPVRSPWWGSASGCPWWPSTSHTGYVAKLPSAVLAVALHDRGGALRWTCRAHPGHRGEVPPPPVGDERVPGDGGGCRALGA